MNKSDIIDQRRAFQKDVDTVYALASKWTKELVEYRKNECIRLIESHPRFENRLYKIHLEAYNKVLSNGPLFK